MYMTLEIVGCGMHQMRLNAALRDAIIEQRPMGWERGACLVALNTTRFSIMYCGVHSITRIHVVARKWICDTYTGKAK